MDPHAPRTSPRDARRRHAARRPPVRRSAFFASRSSSSMPSRSATPVPRHALLVSDNPSSAPPRLIVTTLGRHRDVNAAARELHGGIGPPGRVQRQGLPMDADGGRRRRPRRGARADGRQRGGRASRRPDDAPRERRWRPTRRSSCRNGRTAWSRSGRRRPTRRDSSSARTGSSRRTSGSSARRRRWRCSSRRPSRWRRPSSRRMPARDVAVLWIDPKVIASVPPVPLSCDQAGEAAGRGRTGDFHHRRAAPSAEGHDIRHRQPRRRRMASVSDLDLALWQRGRPGLHGPRRPGRHHLDRRTRTTRPRAGTARVVRSDDACDAVASAEKKMKTAAPPSGTPLPVEPARPFPVDALKDAAEHRGGSLKPYQITSSTFDVAFITPVMTYGAQHQAEQASGTRGSGTRSRRREQPFVRPLTDFGNWSDYVGDFPPVLLVRVTPRLVEGFWTTVARGAATTQGVSICRRSSTSSRASCGCAPSAATPRSRRSTRSSSNSASRRATRSTKVSTSSTPARSGPQCGTVKLVLYSEKEPDKGETRVVDPAVVEQIWQDFAPYRASR